MMYATHSHNDGDRLLPAAHKADICSAIGAMTHPIQRHAAQALRRQFLDALICAGWSGEFVLQATISDISITSVNRTTGLCLQIGGNMSRFYADLLKLQSLYLERVIEQGVFVLPARNVAVSLGDNTANADRLIRELPIFRKVITIPLLVYTLLP
jgi:hypothetical protein